MPSGGLGWRLGSKRAWEAAPGSQSMGSCGPCRIVRFIERRRNGWQLLGIQEPLSKFVVGRSFRHGSHTAAVGSSMVNRREISDENDFREVDRVSRQAAGQRQRSRGNGGSGARCAVAGCRRQTAPKPNRAQAKPRPSQTAPKEVATRLTIVVATAGADATNRLRSCVQAEWLARFFRRCETGPERFARSPSCKFMDEG